MFLALVKKELLALARDLHGLAALFLLPAVFIVVMSLALQDAFGPPQKTLAYAALRADDGAAVGELLQGWQKEHGEPAAGADALARVRSGELKYALVIEPGAAQALTGAAVGAEAAARIRLVADPALDTRLFDALRAELQAAAGQVRMRAAFAALGVPVDTAAASAALVSAERAGPRGPRPSATQQNTAGWLVFGMFFVVFAISHLFVEERAGGALARLRALGVPAWALLAAKALPYLGVNLVQAALMFAVGAWGMPLLGGQALPLGGVNLPALVAVLLCISAAAVGLALLLACLLRTQAQVSVAAPLVNVLLAAIGGIMVPTFVMPTFMQNAARFSPMNWGLEALLAVLLRGGGVAAAAPQLARLLLFALAMFAAAALVFRRTAR